MRLAILTRPDLKSPAILAGLLKKQLLDSGCEASIFYDINLLNRLVSYKNSTLSFHFWLRRKLSHFFSDRKIIQQLKKFDAVVISECIPNGFWKGLYNVEQLKRLIKRPVLFYEVYYLGNAPTQLEGLKKVGDPLFSRYDWHLAVTGTTEIKTKPGKKYSTIGLDLSDTGLQPDPKEEFIALIDFKQPGYEYIQSEQIAVLTKLNIKTIVLEGRYSIEEIRAIYKSASIFFIQFPEAFGLPIAECLSCGVQIFTPDSGWPMSWRLDNNPTVHGKGELAECFTVYDGANNLAQKLIDFRNQYDLLKSPQKVFDGFILHYPTFYFGNKTAITELSQIIEHIRNDKKK